MPSFVSSLSSVKVILIRTNIFYSLLIRTIFNLIGSICLVFLSKLPRKEINRCNMCKTTINISPMLPSQFELFEFFVQTEGKLAKKKYWKKIFDYIFQNGNIHLWVCVKCTVCGTAIVFATLLFQLLFAVGEPKSNYEIAWMYRV